MAIVLSLVGFVSLLRPNAVTDPEGSIGWYVKAAEAGDRGAMVYLARAYGEGAGVAKDEREAMAWYRKAAEAGDNHAILQRDVHELEGRQQIAREPLRRTARKALLLLDLHCSLCPLSADEPKAVSCTCSWSLCGVCFHKSSRTLDCMHTLCR